MWKNYLAASYRATMSGGTYSLINILGLSVGIAATVLVFLYVRFETSYDRWLPDADRLVQMQLITNPPDGEPTRSSMAPRVAVEALRRDFPEFEQVVGMMAARAAIVFEGQPRWSTVHWVDPNFFDVFDLRFVRGDKGSALRDLSSVVLTESEAARYFGTADPIGRVITVDRWGRDQTLRVTGVVADLPDNTHLDLGMIARFNPAIEVDFFMTHWGAQAGYVYAKLRPGTEVAALNARLPVFEKRHLPPATRKGMQSQDSFIDFVFMPVRDIHLDGTFDGAMRPGGDPLAVRAFSIVALLILAIACVNFTNLATARASQRAREVGIRKVLGASRWQLIGQFLLEAIALAAVASIIGLALVELMLPFFNRQLGLNLSLAYLGGGGVLPPALLLTLVVGVAGGAYPAFYLSKFQPARVLKANGAGGGPQGSGRLRNALVFVQFAGSIGLMICTAIVFAQILFARSNDPGFERRGLMVLQGLHPGTAAAREPLARAIERLPGVVSSAYSEIRPGNLDNNSTSVQRRGAATDEKINYASVDYGFFETMRMPLVAGRSFSRSFAKDDASVDYQPATPDEQLLLTRGMNAVLNVEATRRLGFADPRQAIGQELSAELIEEGPVPVTIVGVVADARFGSLRDEVRPVMYRRFELGLGNLIVRYDTDDPAGLRREIEGAWRRIIPDVPFEASFVEDDLAELYDADTKRGEVFAAASALAVLIACLGLYGLAAFTIERRKLEIAVRKLYGADDADIARLMVWQFSRPVLLASLAAWPVAWWLMRDWLDGFAERVSLHAGWFVGASLVALLIAVLTVAGHALRVARTRPARVLRYE